MEKVYTVEFTRDEARLVPLLWNAMYGHQTGVPTGKLRLHNSILDELESILDVGFATEPVYEVLQMTQGKTTLAIHRINTETPDADLIKLELNKNQHEYIKNLLMNIQWTPAISRLAEKLSEKFGIEC